MGYKSTPLDELFDHAHALEACGCRDCGRSGLQWGKVRKSTRYWVAFVFINKQGHLHRAEHDGATLQEAAAIMLDLEFDQAAQAA